MIKNSAISRRSVLKAGAAGIGLLAATAGRNVLAQGAPIRIGHQCDLTGALADTGYWRKKAVDAAVASLNAKGGIAGRKVEVVTVDTESKVEVGILRLRQLIQDSKADFVIGSQHGGISIASNPIMLEQKTLCMSLSRTDATTGKAANPYIFRLMVNTSLAAKSAGKTMIGNTGKRWSIIYADYVWGQGHRDAWVQELKEAGGEVVSAIGIPVNTADPISFVSRIDRSVDAHFIALLGPDMPRVLVALQQLGMGSKSKVLVDAGFGLFDILAFGKQVDQMWSMDSTPFELADRDTPHLRNLRKLVGIDDKGYEIGSKKWCMQGDIWPAFESVSFIKETVEKSGWKTKEDTSKLIKFAEANPNFAESELFPQGDLVVRPADHQAFCDYYTLRIENGGIRMKSKIAKEQGMYPAVVDLTKS